MILQACLNGARPRDFHPELPVTVEAITAQAINCVFAGAGELHLHVRGRDGEESLSPSAVDETILAIRQVLPGTLISISTGAWIEGDDRKRRATIGEWTNLPDVASVNIDEEDAIGVIEALHGRGIGTEAGLSTAGEAALLVKSPVASKIFRILIEPGEEQIDDARAQTAAILDVLDRLPSPKPILLHGFDSTVWPLIEQATACFYSTRIGLEDTNLLPDGTMATSNADLVAAARAIIRGRRQVYAGS